MTVEEAYLSELTHEGPQEAVRLLDNLLADLVWIFAYNENQKWVVEAKLAIDKVWRASIGIDKSETPLRDQYQLAKLVKALRKIRDMRNEPLVAAVQVAREALDKDIGE